MNNERTNGNIGSGKPPLSPNFAYRVLCRADMERRRRIRRGLSVAAGIAAVFCALIVYQGRSGSRAPRQADRATIAAALSGGFSRADPGWPQNPDADARQSMDEYFFPDLRPLAEFNSEYDPPLPLDSSESAS